MDIWAELEAEGVDGARRIYGRDLTRIPSVGWFADAVARLIVSEIKSMTGE